MAAKMASKTRPSKTKAKASKKASGAKKPALKAAVRKPEKKSKPVVRKLEAKKAEALKKPEAKKAEAIKAAATKSRVAAMKAAAKKFASKRAARNSAIPAKPAVATTAKPPVAVKPKAKVAVKAAVAARPVAPKTVVVAKAIAPNAVPAAKAVAAARPVVKQTQPAAVIPAAAGLAKPKLNVVVKPAASTPVAPPRSGAAPIRVIAHNGPQQYAQRLSPMPQRPVFGTPVRPLVPITAPPQPAQPRKKTNQRHGFRTGEHIVYPSHGVGRIVAIEDQVVAGFTLELFVIHFEQEKMTLRVPTAKLEAVGMRKLAEKGIVDRAMETLKGRARIKRTMWSRRAQEYEAKINSGDLVAIAEVVRDLFRAETQPEQSYSERQLYEAALDRMSREIAAIRNLDERGAVQEIQEILSKSARGRKAAEEAAAQATAAGERAA